MAVRSALDLQNNLSEYFKDNLPLEKNVYHFSIVKQGGFFAEEKSEYLLVHNGDSTLAKIKIRTKVLHGQDYLLHGVDVESNSLEERIGLDSKKLLSAARGEFRKTTA